MLKKWPYPPFQRAGWAGTNRQLNGRAKPGGKMKISLTSPLVGRAVRGPRQARPLVGRPWLFLGFFETGVHLWNFFY